MSDAPQAPAPPLQAPARSRWPRSSCCSAPSCSAAYLYRRNRTGSIYHPHARFIPQPTPTLPASGPSRFAWPIFGYAIDHTRFFPAPAYVRPPFKQLWEHASGTLLEFPPVIYGERLFQLGDDGPSSAIDKHTGHVLWSQHLGQLSASSPAVTANTVYVTILYSGHPHSPGRVIALDSANGAIRWWRALPSGSESSPLIHHGRVFFGSQNGTVFALDDSDGAVVWTYRAASAVKASPTLSDGVLYFGDYSGRLQAVSEQTGRRLWVSKSEGALLGSGNFYSTAAVVYGRVFLGNTDGRIYAYDAATGKLDWAVQTGAYVYASPAITNAPGLGPTVYIGSYNGIFYAHQRALRPRQLALQRPRSHLRLGDHHRRRRLLRRPRQTPHLRPRHLHRAHALPKGHRRVRPRHQRRRRRLPHRRHRDLRARARRPARPRAEPQRTRRPPAATAQRRHATTTRPHGKSPPRRTHARAKSAQR